MGKPFTTQAKRSDEQIRAIAYMFIIFCSFSNPDFVRIIETAADCICWMHWLDALAGYIVSNDRPIPLAVCAARDASGRMNGASNLQVGKANVCVDASSFEQKLIIAPLLWH